MSDVWSSQVIIKPLWVILYLNLLFSSTFILSFNKLFFQLVSRKGLDKWVKFFLMIISCRSSRIDKYFRTYNSCQYFRLLTLILLNINHNKKMKILSLVVVSCRWKFHCAKINLAIYHLHFIFPSDTDIKQCNFFWSIIVSILFDSKYLSLYKITRVHRYS